MFDLSDGSTPNIWRDNGLMGLLELCEVVGTSYRGIPTIAVAVDEQVNECLAGLGVGGSQQPRHFHIELVGSVTAETARLYEVVLVEGSCNSPNFISDPVTLNSMSLSITLSSKITLGCSLT